MSSRVPILSYHAILAEDQKQVPGQWSSVHAIPLPAWREQLDVLADGGWQVVALKTLEQSPPRRSLTITFDDGGSCDLVAAEELGSRGLTAAFFVTWSCLGCRWFLSRGQVADLDRLGFTIGSHGMTHARFAELNPQELRNQLLGSRERLEGLLGKPVTALAVPFGSYNHAVVTAAVAAGYRQIVTSDFALAVAGKCVLPRLTITSRTTLRDFRSLLANNRFGIARRRVVNGIHRRLDRIWSMAAGERWRRSAEDV
jgi:peptidoglycan/xylan/chitin deacetylase (PgdA/CDA1 family)